MESYTHLNSYNKRNVHRNYKVGEHLNIPKLGNCKLKWSRFPTGIPKMATIGRDASGRYFVCFSVE